MFAGFVPSGGVASVRTSARSVNDRVSGARVAVRRNGASTTVRMTAAVPSTNAKSLVGATVAPNPEFEKFAKPPPFTMEEVRKAIPQECWRKDATKSTMYLLRDLVTIAVLAAIAVKAANPLVWALYTLAQGTLFWALFVVGHDCGHGSYSNSSLLNEIVGHLTHASILVPFHGWRISHRTHHANHANVDKDESWYPYSKKDYDEMSLSRRMFRFELPVALFGYPVYLFKNTPNKTGSHWLPGSRLFKPSEAGMVVRSTLSCIAMLGLLAAVGAKIGLAMLAKLYMGPLVVFWAWLAAVTYLHHTDESVPSYRNEEWNYFRGALSTVDRDFGPLIDSVHHHIGWHVVHHTFPQIPHYNLVKATEAVKPVLGEYYREPERSGFMPWHLVRSLGDSFKKCRWVDNEGDVVFYKH
ncbi:Omega-3 fatty acid desaturase, chloroplastic [Porphyridium purpureum]|uniref:Omega-3 fatty acid desaturase, chloroplastic n=1 Tax=Porphyridium purpureum TaxID=35688 RepID=A0A5J4Z1L4_PORPP|nr:Omega-3 fatty acid desaturase, chloroplastic [Porphyridium purpureum]|eukprot:POR1500..scf208_2